MTCFEDACQIVGEDPNNPRFNTSDEEDNIRQTPVINIKTKEQFKSISAAAKSVGIDRLTLSQSLDGKRANNTPIRYLLKRDADLAKIKWERLRPAQ
jgi:hypothetical protein